MALFTKDLIVFHDNNSSFSDKSFEANDYTRDTFGLDLVSADDYLYLGLFKRFSAAYVQTFTVNTVSNTFTAEFNNGTTWVTLAQFKDDSQGFTRSGFLTWTRNQTDWALSTVNSEELFWIRLRPSADHDTNTVIKGLNIVFADDNDLVGEFREINQFLSEGDSSFITYHQSARDHMIQMIRNRGKLKVNTSSTLANITKWDILDIDEIREASKHKALSQIFFQASDNIEDKWYQKYTDHLQFYNNAFDVFYLTLDKDDDGQVDDAERLAIKSLTITRL